MVRRLRIREDRNSMSLTLAAYQGLALYNQPQKSLALISEAMSWADKNTVDILCFPECFLQGYLLDEAMARLVSIDLNSKETDVLLEKLYSEKTTLILGIIEQDQQRLYNTAIVIEKGKLIGKYRKRYIHNKETIFTCGADSPIFEIKGVKYGINICYDSRFPESAEALVNQGAQIIFCPLNNSLPHQKADEWRHKHIEFLVNKARLSGCWIISADVVERSEENTGYGCTCLINPKGEIVEYLEHSKVGKFLKHLEI